MPCKPRIRGAPYQLIFRYSTLPGRLVYQPPFLGLSYGSVNFYFFEKQLSKGTITAITNIKTRDVMELSIISIAAYVLEISFILNYHIQQRGPIVKSPSRRIGEAIGSCKRDESGFSVSTHEGEQV